MTKLKKKKKFQVYLISIILIILSLFLIYKFYILKPCSKFLGPEEVRHNISEYPFYELDLSPWVLEGFGNSEIIVNVKCMGEFQRYLFRKNFDFTEFKYVWASEDYDRGVKIKYGFSDNPHDKSNNVLLLVPLAKNGKECRVIPIYSGICR